MSRRSWLWSAVFALACAPVLAGKAQPVEPSVRIVVGYGRSGDDAGALERRLGAEPTAAIPQLRVHVLAVRPERAGAVLAGFRSSPIVRYAERDSLVRALRTPNDEFWPSQWSPRKTNAPKAWNLTTGSPQVIVAVVDSGIDPNQPDLRGRLVPGYDFVNSDAAPGDDNGHGTAVAGVVAASSDNGIGVAGYCWRCRLMPVKVLGADGSGFASTLAQGIVWATDHKARVINASLGGPESDAAVVSATQYASAHGALVVAAAGNDSSSVLEYPAALPGVLSVGASDRHDRLYGFSNSGAAVAAPGGNSTTGRGAAYVSFLGTSSATPVVSGIAALCLSAVPTASPAQLIQALEQSAVPIVGVVFGRVDAYAAVRALAPWLAPPIAAHSTEAHALRGRLGPYGRTFVITSGAGILRATLILQRRARQQVVLELRSGGRLLVAAHGQRRVRLRAHVHRATYRLVLSGAKPAISFRLTVSYPPAA